MERSNSTEALFDIIRKELNTIIQDGEKHERESKELEKREEGKKKLNKANNQGLDKVPTKFGSTKKPTKSSAQSSNRRLASGQTTIRSSPRSTPRSPSPVKNNEQVNTKAGTIPKPIDITKQVDYIEKPIPKSIDEDMQKMQVDLMQSYELFRSIGEKFESVNFGRLQSRIKDLNLSTKKELVGNVRADELKEALDQGFKTNRLDKVTTEMGEKFRNHPGEFGDIPELSTFFQACSQLEHGLENLKSQRMSINNLGNRIERAANANYERINEIQSELKRVNQKPKDKEQTKLN